MSDAAHMNDYMRATLSLFVTDPPDSDFQRGYHEALKVFANEAMGFKYDDPLLWGQSEPSSETARKPKLTLVSSD